MKGPAKRRAPRLPLSLPGVAIGMIFIWVLIMGEFATSVVVGGGTSGLQAALQLAKVGRSVVLLEQRSAGKSGARWCNGVVDWQFDVPVLRFGLRQYIRHRLE